MTFALIFSFSLLWIDGAVWHGEFELERFHSHKRCVTVERWFSAADASGHYRCVVKHKT